MKIFVPHIAYPSVPDLVVVNLDGRLLRSLLSAQPATPEAPAHYTNDLVETRDNGDGTTTNYYARRFNNLTNYPEHADVVYLDQKDGEGGWQLGVVTLMFGDPQCAIITAEGISSQVRYRAVNSNGETLSLVVTIT